MAFEPPNVNLFKMDLDVFSPIISHLCNISISSGVFPDIHKTGCILPLHKGKERDDIENYRPITILNSVSKILEKAISNRLVNHLEENHILSDNQFAYRSGWSTELALSRFTHDIINRFDNGELTIAVLLDLSRAFDCVNHNILKYKLRYYGIRSTGLKWFCSYLTDRKQYVHFNGSSSDVKHISTGVPQGSILGPLLFLLYINDFCESVNSGTQLLFADDATYYESGTCYEEVLRTVNRNLSLISEWFLANRLSVNVVNSELMFFLSSSYIFSIITHYFEF